MPGLRPTVAEPAGLVDEPLTALDACRAVETVLGHVLDAQLARARDLADASGDKEAAAVLAPSAALRPEHTVERMRRALERTGSRAVVVSQIVELATTSLGHFEATGAEPAVRREFAALVERASWVTPLRTRGDM